MSANEIDIRFFKSSPITRLCKFSHKVDKGTMPFSSLNWFRKEMDNAVETSIEALAQEFFRLIIPNQPRTFTAINPLLKTHYILSEEISGFVELPKGEQLKFNRGDFTGLGQIVLTAAFLQEIDLKNGNIGINAHHQVIKIDGDWCFASVQYPNIYKKETLTLTPSLINDLPFPRDYAAHNWLDLMINGKLHREGFMVNPLELCKAQMFRAEINQAMLKILLLPLNYLRQFVDAFMPVGTIADTFIAFLYERQQQLSVCALQNESFKAYLLTPLAKDHARQHFIHMRDFTVNNHYQVVTVHEHHALRHAFAGLQDIMMPLAHAEQPSIALHIDRMFTHHGAPEKALAFNTAEVQHPPPKPPH